MENFPGDSGTSLEGGRLRNRRRFRSRKRRKITLPAVEEDDNDEPVVPVVSHPSRVASRVKNKGAIANLPVPILPTNNKGILAPVDPQTSFTSLGVTPWLVRSLRSMAIKAPTGIQKGCIPEIIKGRDCIGGSKDFHTIRSAR